MKSSSLLMSYSSALYILRIIQNFKIINLIYYPGVCQFCLAKLSVYKMNPSICIYAENNSGVIMMSDVGFLGLGGHFQMHLYPSEQCVNLSLSFSL